MTKFGLVQKEIAPFLLSMGALLLVTLLVDGALHLLNLVWVGRYLGVVGTLLIIGSFAYSARKRKWITAGKPATLLRAHEWMSWAGALLVLVHAGIHFNAWLAWLAVVAMVINVASGLTGKYLLARSRQHMDATRAALREQGVAKPEADERLFWDTVAFDAVKQWRLVHFPITLAFAALGTAHIAASVLFWSWT
jgi:hypothetical protein